MHPATGGLSFIMFYQILMNIIFCKKVYYINIIIEIWKLFNELGHSDPKVASSREKIDANFAKNMLKNKYFIVLAARFHNSLDLCVAERKPSPPIGLNLIISKSKSKNSNLKSFCKKFASQKTMIWCNLLFREIKNFT